MDAKETACRSEPVQPVLILTRNQALFSAQHRAVEAGKTQNLLCFKKLR